MNPVALLLLGLALILIIVGIKGTQSSLLSAFKGVPSIAKGTVPVSTGAVNKSTARNVQAV